jgi:hypothetical protein
MSHQALQRVLVRLLYDPVFAEAVALAPDSALADVPLSQAERGWLAAADPRPFRLDPLRRTRTLRALLDEYPAALALALAAPTRLDVDAFFSSPEFHTAIQDRHALAPRFGAGSPPPPAPTARSAPSPTSRPPSRAYAAPS